MRLLNTKLEIEVDGTYFRIGNIREISFSVNYKPKINRTSRNTDWMSFFGTGGLRDMTLNITGFIAPLYNSQEIQLFDLLLYKYCGSNEVLPTADAILPCRLTLPDGSVMQSEYSVTSCNVSLTIEDFDEYIAQLESCGTPSYERINNNQV